MMRKEYDAEKQNLFFRGWELNDLKGPWSSQYLAPVRAKWVAVLLEAERQRVVDSERERGRSREREGGWRRESLVFETPAIGPEGGTQAEAPCLLISHKDD